MLCRCQVEYNEHLFNSHPFTKELWNKIIVDYNLQVTWIKDTITSFLNKFFTNRVVKSWMSLPFIVSWSIWQSNNMVVFQKKIIPPLITSYMAQVSIKEHIALLTKTTSRIIGLLEIDKSKPWAFFDGASQDRASRCGLGFLFNLNDNCNIPNGFGSLLRPCGTTNNTPISPLTIFR